MRSTKEANVEGKTVLLRTDFDVPIKSGRILDDSRIKESIPTIKYLLRNKAKVLIITHLGRPNEREKKFSLAPVARRLKKLLNMPVIFISDILDKKTKDKIESERAGAVVLFENIRFYEEETKNNFKFAETISLLGDVYINDAFPVSHRAHASVDAVTRYLPSFAGLALEREIKELSKIKNTPHHPFVVVVGGVKISDKIGVILNLAKIADYILIGGASANVFLKVEGFGLGDSLVEDRAKELVLKILRKYSDKIVLPIDVVVSSSLNSKKTETVDITSIPSKICEPPQAVYDIGPKTLIKWQDIIKTAKTIFWIGPVGVFEKPLFSKGTRMIARTISLSSGETVVGGGDTVSALDLFRIKKFSHISTAGSAMLQYISGEELPGLEALERNTK